MKTSVSLLPRRIGRHDPARPSGFTLIEILVVISIIALLAALLIHILPAANERKVRNGIKAQMIGLETAIKQYREKRGFYPPDNTNNGAAVPTDLSARKNPLYYELTGQEPPAAVAPTVFNELGIGGVINSGDNSQNFLNNLKPSAYAPLAPNSEATNLVVAYKGPHGEPNFWHYNSSRPRYNSDSYDLWADVLIGGKTVTIGNWK